MSWVTQDIDMNNWLSRKLHSSKIPALKLALVRNATTLERQDSREIFLF